MRLVFSICILTLTITVLQCFR